VKKAEGGAASGMRGTSNGGGRSGHAGGKRTEKPNLYLRGHLEESLLGAYYPPIMREGKGKWEIPPSGLLFIFPNVAVAGRRRTTRNLHYCEPRKNMK